MTGERFPFHEFFAGSGLVGCGLAPWFRSVWANDISERKAAVYRANLDPSVLHVGDISRVSGADLPAASLSWASFPCQDLSLAGNIDGIYSDRSGSVWQWLRVLDEVGEDPPGVICLENVAGLVSAHGGRDYRCLHAALVRRGYSVGALLINADRFAPQSRPRVFVVGTRGRIPEVLLGDGCSWAHPAALVGLGEAIEGFTWWSLPEPRGRTASLEDIVDPDAPFDRDDVLALIPDSHVAKLSASRQRYATGYRRTRAGRQVLELRCDGTAGCLRTPSGGSSRQYLIAWDGEGMRARLLTVREVARLMGAPEGYRLPGSYNDGYLAMGDAVVPVARHLANNLLSKLVEAAYAVG
ncbi:DNA-cytosine methyltransferase [Coriobacterium glomerans PW2]|uniref:DNA (cytosine-5-)-methyltransferase n=1 Tax=Coriobacterium glomerans (strain ATCC 49209 / DSM 20642 / JCM 10262 / PW2) TaxID=700015 RepID=F2N795_CORGP|nr:DNA (cytosine-5-)-methyltransferase [Coriobacterium glomerans]AEB06570.1 DNA-cytosine methyltransferase [Coriobacterium glomerans PW2]